MIKILVADKINLAGISKLDSRNFLVKKKFGITNSNIIKNYKNYDVLVVRSTRTIGKNFLEETNFKIIATCSKGTDHIGVEYAKKKKIKVLNAEDGNHISAAEHTLALILAIHKNIILSDKITREMKFDFYDFERHELFGKSIGIIGFGRVGSYVGKLCSVFGMQVYANDTDRNVRNKFVDYDFRSLDYILKNCDIVSLHIPLNKKNFHLLSAEKLKLLGKNSILINTSRGDVIEEKSLLKLLRSKKIRYAGLDVFSNEPKINAGFSSLENVILTNHIAGKTEESSKRISENIFLMIKKYSDNDKLLSKNS